MLGLGHARDGASRAAGASGHLLPIRGIASDGGIDAAPGLHEPPHESQVFLLDLAIVKLTCELAVRGIVLCDHHDARRPAIEPVHDAGPELPTDATEVVHVMQQRIHQRPAVVARRWMHHHARRLVEDDDVGVFVEDREGQILGDRDARAWRRHRDGELLASPDVRARAQRGHGTRDEPLLDQTLDVRAGAFGQKPREERVEPFAVVLVPDGQLTPIDVVHRGILCVDSD